MFRRDIFVAGQGGYHSYRIPVLLVSGHDTVLAFCEGRKTDWRDYGDIDLLLKRSTDGGLTWSDPLIVHDEGNDAPITIGNPCPMLVRESDQVHLLFTRNNKRLLHTRSADDGLTWSAPEEITDILNGFEYPCVRLGTGPVHGIRTSSGRLVAPVWVSDGELNDKTRAPTPPRYRSGILYSDDAGASWHAGGLVPPSVDRLNECVAVERRDGTLLLNMRANGAGYRAVATSTDAGLTWSEPVLDRALPCPSCQAAMAPGAQGELYFLNPSVSWTGGYDAGSRRNLTLRRSPDEGRTWTDRLTVHEGPSGYSDLVVTDASRILCLFENGDDIYRERISVAGLSFDPEP